MLLLKERNSFPLCTDLHLFPHPKQVVVNLMPALFIPMPMRSSPRPELSTTDIVEAYFDLVFMSLIL